MILPFIQEIDNEIAEQIEPQDKNMAGNSVLSETSGKETKVLDYSYENSFESKYLHFKEKIEKDRLAWETLAGRK